MKKVFLDHIELWLSALGLLLIVAVPYLFASPEAAWKTTAATAIGVGTAHGILFWAVRRRRERIRRAAREEIEALNRTLEKRVETRTRQVRELASKLTMAEHQERRRISQLLHDDLQQCLYGIQFKIDAIRQDAESKGAARLIEQAEHAHEWTKTAIETTRQLTVDLSPPVLEGEGLVDALGWLVTQMKEAHGLTIELRSDETFRVPAQDMQVLLFQVVRELLFNVVKHAETDRATVTLQQEAQGQVIQVADEGAGFDVQAEAHRDGRQFGLFSARERLGLFGGRMEIDSDVGAGTCVTLRLPAAQTDGPPKERASTGEGAPTVGAAHSSRPLR